MTAFFIILVIDFMKLKNIIKIQIAYILSLILMRLSAWQKGDKRYANNIIFLWDKDLYVL